MGIISGVVNWKSSWNADTDGNDLCHVIENSLAHPAGALTVFFLAETHRNPFDVARSTKVYEKFSKPEYAQSVRLVVERGLFAGCTEVSQVVYEGITELKSGDPRRNQRMVSLLQDELEGSAASVVIVFFGEAHLPGIKDELAKATAPNQKIRWVESLSFTTMFEALRFYEAARFDRSKLEPAGYAAPAPTSVESAYVKLLTKGVFGPRFTIALYRQDQLAWFGRNAEVHALYFKDPVKHATVRGWVEDDGAYDHPFETFDGSSLAVAVRVP